MKKGIGNLNRVPLLLVLTVCFQAAASAADKARLIVFPFERATTVSTAVWLREGIAVEICRQLQLPHVETIDYGRRVEMVLASDLPPNATLSRASMIRVAQQAAADFLVMGSYSEDPQGLRIVANILDLKSLKLGVDLVATGPIRSLPQIENELAWNILDGIGATRGLSRETFRGRMRRVTNDAFALFTRGLTESDEAEAIKLFEQAVALEKNFAEAQLRLGRYYFQQGDCAKAIPQLMAAHDENESHLQEEFMLATCYLETERPADAVQAYDRLNSLAPGIESLNNQGVAYTRKGDYPAAVRNFLQAREMARTDPTINLNLAILQHLQGDNSAAREILTEATKSYPNSGMIQFVYGIVLAALGENEAADTVLARAKNLGIQVEALRGENPGSWTRIMPRGEYP